jgi:DNA-binding CsgD family transcriptional regulator
MQLNHLFKEYCAHKISSVAQPIPEFRKQEIVESLKYSPFRSVVQAFSVLYFYDYSHLYAEGFDTYFGYRNDQITAEKILDIVHPEDQEAFGKLYYLCLEGLLHMPIPTKEIGHFCISYRMRDANGHYHRILETNNIIESCPVTNIPLVNLAQITVGKGIQKSSKVSYYFKIKDAKQSVEIMQGFLSQFDSKVNVFTETELRMVELLKLGMNSREVGEKLFLSKHTIDKYRKIMLEKTETRNTPQLIHYLEELELI